MNTFNQINSAPFREQAIIVPIDPENELLNRLLAHDPAAFKKLYKMYSASLFGIIVRIVDQQETAEDLLQEAFLKIGRYIDTYDRTRSRLFTWMLNIARNTAIDHLRLKTTRSSKTHVDIEASMSQLEHLHININIDAIGLRELVAKLCDRHRNMIDLCYFKGYTHAEISELLNMPLGSVKTLLRKAMMELRSLYGLAA